MAFQPNDSILAGHACNRSQTCLDGSLLPLITSRGRENRRQLKNRLINRIDKNPTPSRSIDVNQARTNLRLILRKVKTDDNGTDLDLLPPIQRDEIRITSQSQGTDPDDSSKQSIIHSEPYRSVRDTITSKYPKKKSPERDSCHLQKIVQNDDNNNVPIFSIKLLKAMTKNSNSLNSKPVNKNKLKEKEKKKKRLSPQRQREIEELEMEITNPSFRSACQRVLEQRKRDFMVRRGQGHVWRDAEHPSFETLVPRQNSGDIEARLLEASEERGRYASGQLIRLENTITPWD